MQTSEILAVASGIAYTLAYLDYNRQVIKGKTKPNGATWLIWSVIGVISTTSYMEVTGDLWKNIIPLLNIFLCIATFGLAMYLKKFNRCDNAEYTALALGITAALVWMTYHSAKYANLIVQFSIFVGFIPTWRGLMTDPKREQSRPWWIWASGYVLALIVVILRWKQQWYDLVYPINCILLHASVPIFAGYIARRRIRLMTMLRSIQVSQVAVAEELGDTNNDATAYQVNHNIQLVERLNREERILKKKLGIA